ncbi:ABC transporter permease subunit [Aquisalimonas sp.]|uniref:ABC transporter permease subunit n=1 Tax=Aquisalimonas sp. TaxID=1872621 RepID=UPI0025B9FEF5|nr:ABC transporter permease subunit [Aquisalimonas sp.]
MIQLESIDRELLEAARTLGANEPTEFRTVTVPNALPYATGNTPRRRVGGRAFSIVLSFT